jgi:hypothetical protein
MALTLAIIALAAGPLAWQVLQGRAGVHKALSLVMSLVMIVLVVLILTHTVVEGGFIAIGFAAGGFLLPLVAEKILHRGEWTVHRLTLGIGIAGLFLHNLTDGVALAAAALSGEPEDVLVFQSAIILHRLPMGLAVWWLVATDFGNRLALLSVSLMALATVAGFLLGDAVLGGIDDVGLAWFIAFVAGSLAHLAVHRLGGSHKGHSH